MKLKGLAAVLSFSMPLSTALEMLLESGDESDVTVHVQEGSESRAYHLHAFIP